MNSATPKIAASPAPVNPSEIDDPICGGLNSCRGVPPDLYYPCGMKMLWIIPGTALLFCLNVENLLYGQSQKPKPSPGIDEIYLEDQRARQPPDPNAPKPVYGSDEEREAATRKLLANGDLKSGQEFREAAVVFQHSRESDDYLLAHTLAMVAVSMGDKDAIRIAAASLDRYLMSIGRPQIYGTQFLTPAGQHATQEPYNRLLISDELRKELQVPSQAEQEVRRKGFDAQ